MKRCLVIINPVAGGGKPKRYAMDLQWQLSTMFDAVEVKFTRQKGDASIFAKGATEAGFDSIFCMGGDGTVNETVDGIMHGGGKAKFGFVPVGTVNDLARALHIPLQPRIAISMLSRAKLMTVDVGRCNDRYFCNNIAAGILPSAVEEVTPKEKALLGPLAYFVRGGQAIFQQQDYSFKIEMPHEGRTFHTKSPLVIALLTNCISSFERFMPMAAVNDGYMRLIVFREYFFMNIFKIVPLILNGNIYNSKYVTILKTQKATISLEAGGHLTTNMDGSRGPALPVELQVLPNCLSVYVPEKPQELTTFEHTIKF